jgi:hypothetical protein
MYVCMQVVTNLFRSKFQNSFQNIYKSLFSNQDVTFDFYCFNYVLLLLFNCFLPDSMIRHNLTKVARFFLVHDTKFGINVPNEHKMYRMVIKYPKYL